MNLFGAQAQRGLGAIYRYVASANHNHLLSEKVRLSVGLGLSQKGQSVQDAFRLHTLNRQLCRVLSSYADVDCPEFFSQLLERHIPSHLGVHSQRHPAYKDAVDVIHGGLRRYAVLGQARRHHASGFGSGINNCGWVTHLY